VEEAARVRARVGEDGGEMDDAAEDGEGAELEEHPAERREVGAGGEVQQLEWDGEVGRADEEVAHLLPLQQRLHRAVLAPVAAAPAPRRCHWSPIELAAAAESLETRRLVAGGISSHY